MQCQYFEVHRSICHSRNQLTVALLVTLKLPRWGSKKANGKSYQVPWMAGNGHVHGGASPAKNDCVAVYIFTTRCS